MKKTAQAYPHPTAVCSKCMGALVKLGSMWQCVSCRRRWVICDCGRKSCEAMPA